MLYEPSQRKFELVAALFLPTFVVHIWNLFNIHKCPVVDKNGNSGTSLGSTDLELFKAGMPSTSHEQISPSNSVRKVLMFSQFLRDIGALHMVSIVDLELNMSNHLSIIYNQ